MIVWGGCRSSACFYPLFDSGGRYDPVADAWRPTSLTGAPYQRRHHTAVWTGQEMIIWGGCVDADCSDFRNSGFVSFDGTLRLTFKSGGQTQQPPPLTFHYHPPTPGTLAVLALGGLVSKRRRS